MSMSEQVQEEAIRGEKAYCMFTISQSNTQVNSYNTTMRLL